MKTILLAYNGTREGRTGLFEFTHAIAPGEVWIHLLAVIRLPTGAFLAEGFVPESVMEEERVRYQQICDEGVGLLVERGYRVTPHLVYGEPTEEIVELAKQLPADLIVVGHKREASMAQRWWKGSVCVSLIEVAPCSVLIAIERSCAKGEGVKE
jgi:nucleotide-binding universal stress UspA family protein